MQKAETLDCDAIIFDLEDAVAPAAKDAAREAMRAHFKSHRRSHKERVVRINGLTTPWGTEDLLAARAVLPDAILIPKVDDIGVVADVFDALGETDAPDTLALWAMIETSRGVINAASTADAARSMRLQCFVVGTNDLFKETGLDGANARIHAHPWLMQIVLAAKAGALGVLDGVFNDLSDLPGCIEQCRQGAQMGFDGKTLIHPSQIEPANGAFAPDADLVDRAHRLVAAFALGENAGKGVIAFEGGMAERLHLAQAEALIDKSERIARRSSGEQEEG